MPKKQDIKFKVGFFPGNWDLLHNGHIRALKEARQYCDYLIVGIKENNNDVPTKNQPIMSVAERKEMLGAFWWIDELVTYKSEKELYELDASKEYNIRFMGIEYKRKRHHPIKAKIVYISRNHNYSTSRLREQIYQAECKKHLS